MAILRDVPIVLNEKGVFGTILFETLDENRLVSSRFSAAIVLMLGERIKNNIDTRLNFDLLLPENMGAISPELKYSQFIVDKNYRLLKPNNLLSFEEALFLLLGLNTEALQTTSYSSFKLHNSEHSYGTIEQVFLSTPVYEVLSRSRFVKGGTILSNDLAEISQQFSFVNQARLNKIQNQESSNECVNKDTETGIPINRLTIYMETLPLFLKGLGEDEAVSLRGLSIDSTETYEGEYTVKYKESLGVGGSAIKKDLSSLFKASWWAAQPDEIRKKVPYFYRK